MATPKKKAQPKADDSKEVKKVLRLPKEPLNYDGMLKRLAASEVRSENNMILVLIERAFKASGLTLD